MESPLSKCHATLSQPDLRKILRIAAAIVAHEGAAYLPLLERLKRAYDDACWNDASTYAHHLLRELAD